VNPNVSSVPIDARLFPIPRDGMFGELWAKADISPISAGIDTGLDIRS